MIKDLMLSHIEQSFMVVEEGIQIYDIEYILLHQYNFYYYNADDPHKDTQYKIGELSDGIFHFAFWMDNNKPMKYVSKLVGAEYINNDYVFDNKLMTCYSAQQLLREYKINKLQTKIKELCTH